MDGELNGNTMYIIAADEAGPVKVGYAKNPELRCRTLQIGNPKKLRVFAVSPCSHGDVIERIVHRHLATKRLNGEWFSATVDDVLQVLDELYTPGNEWMWGVPDIADASANREAPVAKLDNVPKRKTGRPRKYASQAERQRAYRGRQQSSRG